MAINGSTGTNSTPIVEVATVEEIYDIAHVLFDDKISDAEQAGNDSKAQYWESCKSFYLSVEDSRINQISAKQKAWLDRIADEI